MNAKHTRGPWHYSAELLEHGQHVGGRAPAVDSEFGAVCKMNGRDAEAIANARLIAAAPELLAACKRLLTLVPNVNKLASPNVEAIEALADAAIAKAEGREL